MVGAAGAELSKAGEQDAHCCLVPRLLLFISTLLSIFPPAWQAAHQPAEGWVMEKWEGGGFL